MAKCFLQDVGHISRLFTIFVRLIIYFLIFMKKKLLKRVGGRLLWIGMALCVLAACGQKEQLKKAVEEVNKQCPIDMGASGKVESVTYDGKNVVYTYVLQAGIFNMDAVKANSDALKSVIASGLRNPAKDLDEMLRLTIDTRSGLKYVYRDGSSGEEVDCVISTEELQALLDSDLTEEESNRRNLKELVDITNLSFPMEVDEATTVEKLSIEGDWVVYDYTVDEEVVSIDLLEKNKAQMKESLKTNISSGMDVRQFAQTCLDCDKGILYRYKGEKSGNTAVVSFSVDDLKKILG